MPLYDFDFSSEHFWAPIQTRLRAAHVPIVQRLGYAWRDAIEDRFGRWDLASAKLALSARDGAVGTEHGAGLGGTCVVELGPAAERLITTDAITYADSMLDAVAFLVWQACSEKLFPSSLTYDPGAPLLRLELAGQPWAVVHQWVPPLVLKADARRGEQTLVGLRDSSDPLNELVDRLKANPGMEDLDVDESDREASAIHAKRCHLPVPREWWASAAELLQLAGLEVSRDNVKATLESIFGVASWEHLVQAVADYRAAGMQPCAITYSAEWTECVHLYAEPTHALHRFAVEARNRLASDGQGLRLVVLDDHGAPAYLLRKPARAGEQRGELPGVYLNLLRRSSDFSIKGKYLAAVQAMVSSEGRLSEDVLSELFMIGSRARSKLQLADALSGDRLLVEEGRWRFLKTITQRGESQLVVEHVDESGNTLRSPAFAPIYKAELHFVLSRQVYVVCSEHRGRRPVAAPMLTREGAAALARHLPAMRQFSDWVERYAQGWKEEWWDEQDRSTFQRLIHAGGLL